MGDFYGQARQVQLRHSLELGVDKRVGLASDPSQVLLNRLAHGRIDFGEHPLTEDVLEDLIRLGPVGLGDSDGH